MFTENHTVKKTFFLQFSFVDISWEFVTLKLKYVRHLFCPKKFPQNFYFSHINSH